MAQVPYQPFPTVEADPGRGERLRVDTPGAAFGENVAQAVQGLGSSTQKVGDELFQRALALQDLKNENDARTAQTDFATQASQLHATFGALTGQAASDALPKFLDDQKALRLKLRGNLGNPMAQRMYDADTLPFLQRNVFSASSHAAEENKKYTLETLGATAKTYEEQAAAHPDDASYVQTQRDNIKDAVTHQVMIATGAHDPSDPNVVRAVNDALSHQRAEQILAKTTTDAITGAQWAKTYADDLTNPADRDRVNNITEGKAAAVAGSNIARQVVQANTNPDGTLKVSSAQLEQQVRDKAKDVLPDNEQLPDTAVGKLRGLLGAKTYFDKTEQQDAQIWLNDALAKNNITDAQGLQALPDYDQYASKLPPNLRTAPQQQSYINRFNSAAEKQTNQEMATTINGMRTSDSAAFMSLDPTDPKWHLNKQDIIRVQNQQSEMSKNPQDDPRVSRAMGWLLGARGAELKELNVDQKKSGYEDDFYHFRGAMQEALQVYQEDHPGKQPTYEEVVDKIGPQIIKTQFSKPGFFSIGGYGTTNTEPAFKEFNRPNLEDIPTSVREKIGADFAAKGVPAPTERELVQIYARQQFNKFYKQAKPSE